MEAAAAASLADRLQRRYKPGNSKKPWHIQGRQNGD
jgi:hypothetical protein